MARRVVIEKGISPCKLNVLNINNINNNNVTTLCNVELLYFNINIATSSYFVSNCGPAVVLIRLWVCGNYVRTYIHTTCRVRSQVHDNKYNRHSLYSKLILIIISIITRTNRSGRIDQLK